MPKGRPKGSENTSDIVNVEPSRCKTCKSTRRGAYAGTANVHEYSGEHDGNPFNRIVRRRCQCLDCGQWRFDCAFEYHPPGEPDGEEAQTE